MFPNYNARDLIKKHIVKQKDMNTITHHEVKKNVSIYITMVNFAIRAQRYIGN